MKVAVVTGHFMPELGYQESYLARAFARTGHQVRVFTSTAVSPNGRKFIKQPYAPGLSKDAALGFEILRLPAAISFGANVLARGLRAAVDDFDPELVVVIAVAKLFPWPLFTGPSAGSARLVALFGDAREYADRTSPAKRVRSWLQRLLFKVVKRPLYARAVRACDRIVLNHPETLDVLSGELAEPERAMLREKQLPMTLGYDPDEFYSSAEERIGGRRQLGISDSDVLVITCTRVSPTKHLERVVSAIDELHARDLPVVYLIIGFQGDSYGNQLQDFIAGQAQPERFHCLPVLPHAEVRRFYNAADIGVWVKAAISIQEAMGTGLSVLLERKVIVGHLVEPGVNGWYYDAQDFGKALANAVAEIAGEKDRAGRRARALAHNRERFSYDSIAAAIIAGT